MLVFGTVGIFRKYITLSSGLLACARGFLGGAFLLAFIVLTRRHPQKLERKTVLMLILSGMLMAINWILLFESYNYTTVGTATLCYYMQPTILMLMSPLVFKEKLTTKKLICALTAIAGMVLVSGVIGDTGTSSQDTLGIICGLGAAVFYASVITLNKKTQVDDAYQKTCIQLFSAAITVIPYILLTEDVSAVSLDTRTIVLVLILGIVHTGITYALYFGSMRDLKAQSIAVLGYIDPVSSLIFAAIILHEQLSLLGLAGAVLIIGSALVSELNFKRRLGCS
jgi:RarD protein